jgi:hypothetical protein
MHMAKKVITLTVLLVLMVFASVIVSKAEAEEVGNFTQIVQTVDLLKSGQLPVQPAKVGEKVAIKDVVETQKDSRAQMQFVDKSTMVVAPRSKITIEDYMVDRKTGASQVSTQLFQGLVRTVVSQEAKKSFILKTTTAIMGIKG